METWKNHVMHIFVTVFLSNFASLLVNPTIADITIEAVCPGQDECSLAIYLTGSQQAIAGLGSAVMMPLIGNLSDKYGRKVMLTIPLTLAIIPLVILAVKRTSEFFYIYYVLKTITAMVTEGGVICLSLSYLADNVSEGKRVSAFGLLSGAVSVATVCGTFSARLLPTDRIYQVAAVVSVIAAVYMSIFLKEEKTRQTTDDNCNALEHPILKSVTENDEEKNSSSESESASVDSIKKIPLPKEIVRLLRISFTVSLASIVAFFNSLAEAGLQAFLMYYLKARFHFRKDQFADISLIAYISATVSNMLLMPTLGPILGEETLLCIGLFAGFLNMLLNSIAWSPSVPYASAFLGIFFVLACIISKHVGPYEQGIAQGCLMGVASLAYVVSPLIYTPLSALFLSNAAPFYFPGFSILCIGFAWLIGFALSTFIKIRPLRIRDRAQRVPCVLA